MRFSRGIERLLLIVGVLLIGIYVAAYIHRRILSHAELRRFQEAQPRPSPVGFPPGSQGNFDFSLWSENRIAAYERSLAEHFEPPLAVLRISKVHLEVPVLEGTDDLTLNRAVGHIAGTVHPGEDGNIGLAGHRDGFFRVLKDVGPGDSIELVTPGHTNTYVVDKIVLVRPDDMSVLQPRSVSSLTLVTCYPFYYVGSAPERYIVQASIAEPSRLNRQAKSEYADKAAREHQ
jgi:sortase A